VTTPPPFLGAALLSATMPISHIEQVLGQIRGRPTFISITGHDVIGDLTWTRLRQISNVTLYSADEGDYGLVKFADDGSSAKYPIDDEITIVMAEQAD
jgi:hypothetical protein